MKKDLTGQHRGVYSPSMADAIHPRQCLRCGHVWYPRGLELPQTCAKRSCRSPYWNRPRTRKPTVQAIRPTQANRKSTAKTR